MRMLPNHAWPCKHHAHTWHPSTGREDLDSGLVVSPYSGTSINGLHFLDQGWRHDRWRRPDVKGARFIRLPSRLGQIGTWHGRTGRRGQWLLAQESCVTSDVSVKMCGTNSKINYSYCIHGGAASGRERDETCSVRVCVSYT